VWVEGNEERNTKVEVETRHMYDEHLDRSRCKLDQNPGVFWKMVFTQCVVKSGISLFSVSKHSYPPISIPTHLVLNEPDPESIETMPERIQKYRI
jgi:hypothetical protein